MNRRKVLLALPLLAGGAALSYGALKWYNWNKDPDFGFLNRSQPLLSAIADAIVPKTDSPSASECGVPEFIIQLITTCTDIRSQNRFINGLKELEAYAHVSFKRSFSECYKNEQIQILNHFNEQDKIIEGKVGKIEAFFTGRPFSTTLREYCIIGYFTSEGGATQAVHYSHVPGKYVACVPYTQGDKAWATY